MGARKTIEGPDGMVPRDQVEADFERLRREYDAEDEDRKSAEPEKTHAVKLRGPDHDARGDAWVGSYASLEEAEAVADKLRPRFGDRVRVGPYPWTAY